MEINAEFFVYLAIGLGLLAFGWTLFRLGLTASGFILGYVGGYSTYQLVLEWLPKLNEELIEYIPTHPFAPILAGIILGVVGMIVTKRIYSVLVFVATMIGCLYILYAPEVEGLIRVYIDRGLEMLGVLENLNEVFGDLWPALIALVIAIIVVYYQRQVMIIITATVGAFIIVETIGIKILFLPLAFIGILIQQKGRKMRKKPKQEEQYE